MPDQFDSQRPGQFPDEFAPTDQQRAEASGLVDPAAEQQAAQELADRLAGAGVPRTAVPPALEAVDPEPLTVVEPGPLEVAGFYTIRGNAFTAAQTISGIAPDTFDRLIAFAEDAGRRARLTGADRAVLDAVDTDLSVLRACKRFGQALAEVNERAGARAKLTGTGQAGGKIDLPR